MQKNRHTLWTHTHTHKSRTVVYITHYDYEYIGNKLQMIEISQYDKQTNANLRVHSFSLKWACIFKDTNEKNLKWHRSKIFTIICTIQEGKRQRESERKKENKRKGRKTSYCQVAETQRLKIFNRCLFSEWTFLYAKRNFKYWHSILMCVVWVAVIYSTNKLTRTLLGC